jgi:ferredoxin-type protein NapG/ferredoxin-type protein NapH
MLKHNLRASTANGESRAMAHARLAARCCALAAAVLAAGPVVSSAWAAKVLVALSPLVAAGSAVAARAVTFTTLIAVPVLAAALVRRRWFCRWLCPTGLICEQVGRIGSVVGCRPPRIGPVGHWLALVTLGGACLGYPVLLWLDPLAILASFLGTQWSDAFTSASLACAAGLSILVVLSLSAPGLWCTRICPLGATQELLAALPRLGRSKQESGAEGGRALGRRAVVAGGLGAAWAWVVRRSGHQPPIRPPGAIDEPRFRGVCVRCGNCVRACPTKILRADHGEHGWSGLLTPVVLFDPGYCREDCCRCSDACPSGAIARLLPAEKRTARMGLAKVDMDVCLLGDDRECSICRNACPYEAIKLLWSEEEYKVVPKVDPARCPGCGACQVACPTSPRKAIVVVV